MSNFSKIVNEYFPENAIRVIVGDTETYIGVNCGGLNEMKPEQIEWLDSHNPTSVKWGVKWGQWEKVIKYRKSVQYEKIVWG